MFMLSCVVRQQDVGIVGGVGLEQLVHHAKQVLARETGAHPVAVGATATGLLL